MNTLQTIKRRKVNWVGHIQGKIEERFKVMRARGKRHKQPLVDLREKREY
jgi:hypothetical protein